MKLLHPSTLGEVELPCLELWKCTETLTEHFLERKILPFTNFKACPNRKYLLILSKVLGVTTINYPYLEGPC